MTVIYHIVSRQIKFEFKFQYPDYISSACEIIISVYLMEDLTTPNKRRKASITPSTADYSFGLSPFLAQGNPFYMCCKSPVPVQLSYVSPSRNPVRPQRLEELLIRICDQLSTSTSACFAEPAAAVAAPLKLSAKKSVTPAKPAETGAESTCEGSDLKLIKGNDFAESERKVQQQQQKAFSPGNTMAEKKELSAEDRVVRRRKRKSAEQLKLLLKEYKKNANWNKGMMTEMSKMTGLSEAQVYKWSWDQKKKKVEEP